MTPEEWSLVLVAVTTFWLFVWKRTERDAAESAFVEAFEADFGTHHPPFLRCSYREALQQASREHKLLLLYLHSPQHEDTQRFCRDTLCDEVLVDFMRENLIVWGGDVTRSEAHAVSLALQHTTFPHLALVLAGAKPTLLSSFPGHCSPDELLHRLAQAVEDHSAALTAARRESEEMQYNRMLRAQQDAEFEASLAADRAREAAREAQATQAAAELEVTARSAQAEAAAAAAAEAARIESKRAAAERARPMAARRELGSTSLPPEPASGDGIVQLVVRLPDGKRLQRRFASGATSVEQLFDWVASHSVPLTTDFLLVTSHPRRVYVRSQQTLAGAGLEQAAALLVEIMDAEG